LLAALPLFAVVPHVQAEGYTLTITPPYTQEANSPVVTLSLTVTGANEALSYLFEWVVMDPAGNSKNTQSSQPPGSTSFNLTVAYPASFGGGAVIGFVGLYDVRVSQTAPLVPGWVAVGSFSIGLTDKAVYSRTSAISIKATSYSAGEDVTIDLTRAGINVTGFPRHVFADSNGDVVSTWQTGPSTLTGDYTVTLRGATTPAKSPSDTQVFTVQSATLGVTVTVPNTTLGPGQVLTIAASATYPDTMGLTQGTVVATLSTSGSQIGSQLALGFDQNQARWVGSYSVKETDPTGIWLVEALASDPYGNTGRGSASTSASIPPPQSPLTSFWFLTVLGAAAMGALVGFLLLKRKRVTRTQLQVDLQAVGREADRVKNQEFFRSVQRQLSHLREGPEENNDG